MKLKKTETLISLLLISFSTLSNANLVKRQYIGCFKDSHSRDFTGPIFIQYSHMTLNLCQKLCSDRNFKYFGVQFSVFCFCGDSFGKYGYSRDCDFRCSGNWRQICGGKWKNSIYYLDYTTETTTTSTKRTTKIFELKNNTFEDAGNDQSFKPLLNWTICPNETTMGKTENLMLIFFSDGNFTLFVEDIEKNLISLNVSGNNSIVISQNFTSLGEFYLEAFDSNFYSLSRCNITVKENENFIIGELERFELDLDDLDVILGLLKQKGDISNCLKNCSNNGKCKSASNNTIKCFCNEHFTGVDCSFDMRPCSSKQCLNNGECVEINASSFECNCSGNYFGNRCQFLKNELCSNKTCSSHGYCYFSEKDTKVKCKCFKYYTGEDCEIEANEIKQIKKTIKVTTIIALVVIFLTVAFFIILDIAGKFEKKNAKSSKKIQKKIYKLVYVN